MAALLGCLQDWDGIFFFDYDAFERNKNSGASPFRRDHVRSFFSFCGQPVKLAVFQLFSRFFVEGHLAPLSKSLLGSPDESPEGEFALSYRLGVATSTSPVAPDDTETAAIIQKLRTEDDSVNWEFKPPNFGVIRIQSPTCRGVWGTIANHDTNLRGVRIQIGDIDPNYGIVVVISKDGREVETSRSLLLFAASHSVNSGMKWNRTRTSVGDQWGTGPTRVHTFETIVTLPGDRLTRCHSLCPRGHRIESVPCDTKNDSTRIRIGPENKSIWFEIERE
jgi:hypothetical protein